MTTSEAFTATHHDALRAWARGMYPLEAATELLIRGCGGRFAETGQVWVHIEDRGRAWIDFDELAEQLAAGGSWSGGDRRLLVLAASLGADGGYSTTTWPAWTGTTSPWCWPRSVTPAVATNTRPPPILIDDAGNAYRNPDQERPGPLYAWPRGTT